MAAVRDDAQGGINTLIADQRKTTHDLGGHCTLTLVEFDDNANTVYDFKDLFEVPDPAYTLIPRGSTALRDAMGDLIRSTGSRLKLLRESKRPGLVLFVVQTDGQENASHRVSDEELKGLVTKQTVDYDWKFVFLGSNIDAFHTGALYGFDPHATINYASTQLGTRSVYGSTSGLITSARVASAAGQNVVAAFNDQDRQDAVK